MSSGDEHSSPDPLEPLADLYDDYGPIKPFVNPPTLPDVEMAEPEAPESSRLDMKEAQQHTNSSISFSHIKALKDSTEDNHAGMKVARVKRQLIESEISEVLKNEGVELNEEEIQEIFSSGRPEKCQVIGKSVFQYQDLAPEVRKLFLQGSSKGSKEFENMIYSCDD